MNKYDKNGKEHGEWKWYRSNGELKRVEHYEYGELVKPKKKEVK